MIGCTLGPEEAYRFARGETVTSSTGLKARLPRPLDFLVVADHAESIGAGPAIQRGDPVIMKSEFGRQLHKFASQGTPEGAAAAYDLWLKAGREGTNTLAGEPLIEITQMKGTGEAHPMLSPEDEFADFELMDTGSFGPQVKTPEMLPRESAHEALKRGLAYETSLGVNPFKFGFIGSTDAHTALSTTTEDNTSEKSSPSNQQMIRFASKKSSWDAPDRQKQDLMRDKSVPRACAASGLAKTPAKPSGMRWLAKKSLPPREPG